MKWAHAGIVLNFMILNFIPYLTAHATSNKNEVTLMVGAYWFEEGSRWGAQQVLRGGIGRYVTPQNSLELQTTFTLRSETIHSGRGSTVDAKSFIYGLDYYFYFFPRSFQNEDRLFYPFLTLGISGVNLRRDEAHDDHSIFFGGGVGMKYFVTSRVAFKFALRRFAASIHPSNMSSNEASHRVRLDTLVSGMTISF